MSYSDYTLKKAKQDLGLSFIEDQDLFFHIPELSVSGYLAATLEYNMPLAMAIGTEKARSELIIANVLIEVRKQLDNRISLFSGAALDVDKDLGLTGLCDFILSKSPEQFYIAAPIIAVVEAKNENIVGGLGQCVAEMYAAALFNQRESSPIPAVYGAVTTGNTWKFLKLAGNTAHIDTQEYHIARSGKIVGILAGMAKQEA